MKRISSNAIQPASDWHRWLKDALAMNLKSQKDILNLLHDGSIIAIDKKPPNFLLTIAIQYLAEMISEDFCYLFLLLQNCKRFDFLIWENGQTLTNIATIAGLEPEILSAEVDEEKIITKCALKQRFGGTLTIKTNGMEIFDQSRQRLTLKYLECLSKKYWQQKTKNNEPKTGY